MRDVFTVGRRERRALNAPSSAEQAANRGLFDVNGKTVLVTGGSRGIGEMIARGFVAGGANVCISSRKSDACERLAQELSATGRCISIPADLSREDECVRVAEELGSLYDRLDVLVNNAGTSWGADITQFNEAAWEKVLALNLKGVFHLTKCLLPLLTAAGTADDPARIINIGSVDGIRVPPLWMWENYPYAASKAAIHHMTRHFAVKLAPAICVNAIAPGPFDTDMMAFSLKEKGDEIIETTLLKRMGRADDIAGTALFLASRAGSYITGVVLPVDGGIVSAA